jgi:hypothetical protein
MNIPANVNAQWLATLGNDQLLRAEKTLRAEFSKEETAARASAGERYVLLEGPASLVNAWSRWLMASNEARERGVIVARKASAGRPRRVVADA